MRQELVDLRGRVDLHADEDVGEVVERVHSVRLAGRNERVEAGEVLAGFVVSDPALYQDFARAKPLIERQRAAKEALESLYAAWEAAHERLVAATQGS
jgi:hypothetical protein